MAAELHPPDNQITAAAATAAAATTTATTADAAATTTTAILPAQTEPATGPPLASKRQRRPSVRLGEIGDQPSYDSSHVRRTKPQPHTWRPSKDLSSKSIKARSLTNLVNGGDSHEYQDTDEKNQNGGGGDSSNLEFTHRKVKSKRAMTTKRARTNWVSRVEEGADGDSREDGDETFRDFDPDSDSQLKDQSPVHSVDNVALDFWPGHRRPSSGLGRPRVSESRENEFDNNLEAERGGGGGGGDGVRTWLIELGLSRYAPVFEIHEVDDEVLPMLTLEDLKDMGINAVGSRRKLYTAIQKLRKGFS